MSDFFSAPAGKEPGGITPAVNSLPNLSAGAAPTAQKTAPGEYPWDTLGRLLWGTGAEGGTLGQIPIMGDFMRSVRGVGPGTAFGLTTAIEAGANALGMVPAGVTGSNQGSIPNANPVSGPAAGEQGLGSPGAINVVNPLDSAKYPGTPTGALQLMQDMESKMLSVADKFNLIGMYQQQYDPEAYQGWLQTLQNAQSKMYSLGPVQLSAKAAETLSQYLHQWGQTYADGTPQGMQGLYETMPELAFGGEGSLGQSLGDLLSMYMIPQHEIEKAAAWQSGRQGGMLSFGSGWTTSGHPELGSRLDNLLSLPENQLTAVEKEAVNGLQKGGWTPEHAYNFLVDHGQGYSNNPLSQLASAVFLDPIGDATMISAGGARWAALLRAGGMSETGAARGMNFMRGAGKALGTFTKEVQDSPLGPAAKVARRIIDPFSAFGNGPKQVAKTNVMSAVGMRGLSLGYEGGIEDALARASRWGIKSEADNAFGIAGADNVLNAFAGSTVDDLIHTGNITPRTAIPEELIRGQAENAIKKTAVQKVAEQAQKTKVVYLSEADKAALEDRIVVMTHQPLDTVTEAMTEMAHNEQAAWHLGTYHTADVEFMDAVAKIAPDEWGTLAPRVGDMVLQNPQILNEVTVQGIVDTIKDPALSSADRIRIWNQFVDRWSSLREMGKVNSNGITKLNENIMDLERAIKQGYFHGGLTEEEMANLPKQFVQDFMERWVGRDGQPLWNLGFRPAAEDASGVLYNEMTGLPYRRFDPLIEHVTTGLPMSRGRLAPVTDMLGRIIPQAVQGSRVGQGVGRTMDAMEVAINVARDRITGQRMQAAIQQNFRRAIQEMDAGISDNVAKDVFRLSRDYSVEHSFTLAGMTENEFWTASKEALQDIVTEKVGKREIFAALEKAAAGDMRIMGISNWGTQRIRASLIARGIDPGNKVGVVTAKLYNWLRYATNLTFILQNNLDAPWFNMLLGIPVDLKGQLPKTGSEASETLKLVGKLSNTGLQRNLLMDYTELAPILRLQENLADRIAGLPGAKDAIGAFDAQSRLPQMVLNNEANFIHSRLGDAVYDSIETTAKWAKEQAKLAPTDELAALWQESAVDRLPLWEHMQTEAERIAGRQLSRNEVGRRFYSELFDDSRLGVKRPDGSVDLSGVWKKGQAIMPTNVGALGSLDKDWYAAQLSYPNVHDTATLRASIARKARTWDDVKETMVRLGYNEDQIGRIITGMKFEPGQFWSGVRKDFGLSRSEMSALQTYVDRSAATLGMSSVDYLSQVLPATVQGATKEALAQEVRRAAVEQVPWAPRAVRTMLPDEALQGIKQSIADTTGATVDAGTGAHYEAVKGYQVGFEKLTRPGTTERYSSVFPAKGATDAQLSEAFARASEAGSPHIGFYTDEKTGLMHVDPGDTISGAGNAHAAAQVRGEKSIWGWKQSAAQQFNKADIITRPIITTATGLEPHMRDIMDLIHAAEQGDPELLDKVTKAVVDHIQPSLTPKLLSAFERRIMAPDGLLTQAVRAGDEVKAEEYRQLASTLATGEWTPAATQQFRDMVLQRAGIENGVAGSVVSSVPEGFTLNPQDVIAGEGHVVGLKQEGFYHVTTAKDAVMRDGLKSIDQLPEGASGLGSKGDTNMIGRVPTVTDRTVAQTIENRLKLTARAARGEASFDEVLAEFRPLYDKEYGAEGPAKMLAALGGEGGVYETPQQVYRAVQELDLALPGFEHATVLTPFEVAAKWDPEQITTVQVAAKKSRTLDYVVGTDKSKGEIDLPVGDVRVIGKPLPFADADVERASRLFSEYIQKIMPELDAHDVMRQIAKNVPMDGATPYDMTQNMLLSTLRQQFLNAQEDAITSAMINPTRTVLERSLNHPMFGLYPSSFMWGKVLPKSLRFLAWDPFGVHTLSMLETTYKVQETMALQSMYDPRMKQLWDEFGKSGVTAFMSYMLPSMPWDDFKSSLPPWARDVVKGSPNLIQDQFDMMNPNRWWKQETRAGAEVWKTAANTLTPKQGQLTPQQQLQLQQFAQQTGSAPAAPAAPNLTEPVQGAELQPTLQSAFDQLDEILRRK